MIKKLLSIIGLAAAGAFVVRTVRRPARDSSPSLAARPQRIPAETLEVRTEVPPEAESEPPVEPQEERLARRPSPVPREHPVWSPPVEGSSTGKHAYRADDAPDDGDANR